MKNITILNNRKNKQTKTQFKTNHTIASSKSKRSKLSSVSFLGKNKLQEKKKYTSLHGEQSNLIGSVWDTSSMSWVLLYKGWITLPSG